jgi:predicted nucleic acid-binding protein
VILYLDTSALAKQYVDEPGSAMVDTWLDTSQIVGTSLITAAEATAALAEVHRMGLLDEYLAREAVKRFREQWSSYVRLPLTEAIVWRAAEFAWDYGLRGYDAVHLATARLWQEGLGEPVTVATFDQKMREAAVAAGLRTPPQ